MVCNGILVNVWWGFYCLLRVFLNILCWFLRKVWCVIFRWLMVLFIFGRNIRIFIVCCLIVWRCLVWVSVVWLYCV